MKITTKLWIGLAGLVILSPLGLLLPKHFEAGTAWGEWGVSQIQKLAGYVPGGLEKLSSLWHAPISGYCFRGWQEKGLGSLSFAYIISAAAGIILVILLMWLIARILIKK